MQYLLAAMPLAPQTYLGILGLPGGSEWIILLILGLLIFGRRLPEVGRSLGRGIVEFKKGVRGIDEEVEEESSRPSKRMPDSPKQELPHGRARQEESASDASDDYAAVEERRGEG